MADALLVQVGKGAGKSVGNASNPGCSELKPGCPAAAQQHLQIRLLRQGRPIHALQHQRMRLRHNCHHPARAVHAQPRTST